VPKTWFQDLEWCVRCEEVLTGSGLSMWCRCQRPGFRTWSGGGHASLMPVAGARLWSFRSAHKERRNMLSNVPWSCYFWASFAPTCCQSCCLPLPSSDDSRLHLPKPLTLIFSFRLGLGPVWGSPLRIAEQLWRKWYVSACGGFREDSPLSVVEARKRF